MKIINPMQSSTTVLILKLVIFNLILILQTYESRAQTDTVLVREQVYGTWVVDYDETIAGMENADKAIYQSKSPQWKAGIKKLLTGRKLTFGEDGYFSMASADGRSFDGSWSLLANNRMIQIALQGNQGFLLSVRELSGTSMVIRIQNTDQTQAVAVRDWNLNKEF